MKRCPNCGQIFEDETEFCVNDGTPLSAYGSFVSADVPTQVFAPVGGRLAPPRETGKLIYVAVGVMATVIVVLAGILLFWQSDKKDGASNKERTAQTSPKPEQTSRPVPVNSVVSANSVDVKAPVVQPVTESAARELVERWRRAQNMKNYPAYRSCYALTTEFIGIKRTPTGREQMGINKWLAERAQMNRNIVEVRVDNLGVSIDSETAVAVFTQNWRSVNHCDTGMKTLRIKMFADGPKIVYEELRDPVSCG
jgi:hypothetical protein